MHVGSASNTNPAYTGIPAHCGRVHPDRVIVPMPIVGDPAPGTRHFARVLRDENQSPYALGTQARGLSSDAVIYRSGHAPIIPSASAAKLLPKLNELVPVTSTPEQAVRIVTTQQQVISATGRSLDLFV